MEQIIEILNTMKSSRVSNYVIAGLDSYLVDKGTVRLFENSRNHQDQITPHSHRFDFTCLVLSGEVTNRIWKECDADEGDFFQTSKLTYKGEIGAHSLMWGGRGFWRYKDSHYETGECYSMKAEQVHSIQFSKGAKVLFFEGPEKSKKSMIIEPIVNDEIIKTYKKLDYMFKVEG